MFVLSVIEDKLKVVPESFLRPMSEVLQEQVETKYSNKVVLEVGLCVCFYDFLEVGDPYVYPSEGSAILLVKFRLVVFRPFVGEVLLGKVTKSNPSGICVSLGFFEVYFVF